MLQNVVKVQSQGISVGQCRRHNRHHCYGWALFTAQRSSTPTRTAFLSVMIIIIIIVVAIMLRVSWAHTEQLYYSLNYFV